MKAAGSAAANAVDVSTATALAAETQTARAVTTPMSELRPGQKGWIDSYSVEDDAVLRLAEMGLVQGEVVRMLKVAPLGDPMEIEVMGYRLCLRKKEATRIRIRLHP